MRHRFPWAKAFGIACALAISGRVTNAQKQTGESGGPCWSDRKVECSMAIARAGNDADTQTWVRYMVLWHAPDYSALSPDSATQRLGYERFKSEQAGAVNVGRVGIGGVTAGYWRTAATKRNAQGAGADSLFVAEQQYRIPERDTVLIVLVDSVGSATHEPRVEYSELIPTTSLSSFPYKWWMQDNQERTVGGDEIEPWLRTLLATSPRVQQYLARRR